MTDQWRNYQNGDGWVLVTNSEVIRGNQPGGLNLHQVARCTRNWRYLSRHMNTTMRYW